ncbi:MAG: peroxiredoxin [Bacteroidetes bacterium GWF2_29_10]|nr:MAG: peroxiredoxin [Bacteroidetes bacterium GWF2_29_10]
MAILKEKDKAPLFNGINQEGNVINIKDFIGKKIILYFYPKDNTPGCTAQACNLRDNYNKLIDKGFIVIGISNDSDKSHKNFATKHNLPFHLIADIDKNIVNLYGVYGQKKFMGKEYMGINRTTFIISEKGIIEHIINKVDTKNHTQQIIEILNLK